MPQDNPRPPALKKEFLPLIGKAKEVAKQHNISPELFLSLIQRESGGDQNAKSHKGAVGLTQLIPSTAKEMGLDPFDTVQNIEGGAAFLEKMLARYKGNEKLALAAYNAGPGKVKGKIPNIPETKKYVETIQSSKPYYAQELFPQTEQARHTAYGEGNINLFSRPISKNEDGSTSTLFSMSGEDNGKEVLFPGVDVKGEGIISPQKAFAQYKASGKHLGKFDSPDEATTYALDLHKQADRGNFTVPLATSEKSVEPEKLGSLMDYLVTGKQPLIPPDSSYLGRLLDHGKR